MYIKRASYPGPWRSLGTRLHKKTHKVPLAETKFKIVLCSNVSIQFDNLLHSYVYNVEQKLRQHCDCAVHVAGHQVKTHEADQILWYCLWNCSGYSLFA